MTLVFLPLLNTVLLMLPNSAPLITRASRVYFSLGGGILFINSATIGFTGCIGSFCRFAKSTSQIFPSGEGQFCQLLNLPFAAGWAVSSTGLPCVNRGVVPQSSRQLSGVGEVFSSPGPLFCIGTC